MYNVIICDDIEKDRNKIEEATKLFFNNKKIDYRIYSFSDYNNDFYKLAKSSLSHKLYLLDIETPSRSGIDVARELRDIDVECIIVFLTGHEELGQVLLSDDIMFLSFINKFNDFDNRIEKCFKKALRVLKHKSSIKIDEHNITYTINLDDILYITKDSFERKTIIVTTYGEIKVSKSLKEVVGMLDDRFIQTHRACYVNDNKVSSIDKTNKLIKFNNNTQTDLLSDRFKKRV